MPECRKKIVAWTLCAERTPDCIAYGIKIECLPMILSSGRYFGKPTHSALKLKLQLHLFYVLSICRISSHLAKWTVYFLLRKAIFLFNFLCTDIVNNLICNTDSKVMISKELKRRMKRFSRMFNLFSGLQWLRVDVFSSRG